ncbi:MAG: hypothetical protein SXG53_23015 [Pseudomonadota bacterium]|nr:hypothetical protein [Pseudomonadota bacterium]
MNNSLKFAVAGALALSAVNAFALDPSEIQTAAGNGTLVTLYVSGATATDNALENLFKLDNAANRVCAPGSLDIYYFKSASGSASQRALTCTAAFSGAGITSGTTRLALLKESAGGSANGIINPSNGTPLSFLDIVNTGSNFTTSCAAVTGSGNTLPGAAGTWESRDCGYVSGTPSSVTRSNFAPQAGISDVDPGTFVGTGGVTAQHEQDLTRERASVAVTFNPIVSVPLFTVLQRAYGTIGATASEDTSSVASVPSMPSSLLRAIFNGNSVLAANEININGVKLSNRLSGFDSAGDIYVCRRGDTSGTMTSFKLNFLNQGCSKNPALNVSFVTPDTTSCTAAGCSWGPTFQSDFVFAGSGSGDVRACIDYHSSQGHLAVGVASTESKPGTTSNRFRYVKVDGAEPTLKAVMEGRYSFFTENTFNDRFPNTSVSGSQTLWDKVYGSIGNSVALAGVNNSWRSSVALTGPDDGTGDTGILDIASASNATTIGNLFSDGAISGGEVRSTPVNSQTRATLNGAPNNCNLPYQAYP